MQELIRANEELGKRMPLFINHDSARLWFKQEFGHSFVMVDSKIIADVKFYIYHLVHDRMVYLKSMNAIREGSPFIQSEFKDSYTEFEISEEGFVFIKKGGNDIELSKQRNVNRIHS